MPNTLHLAEASLNDKYTNERGWLYMTGIQALVRLPIQQRLRDAAAGLSTGAYISGYRGSPMGRYDMELWAAADVLKQHNIQFRAGLNEDLAATAIWGSQYVGAFPGAKVDGVFGIWYGKGPGVDRSGDALRHANLAGTSALGGVLAIAGDDHGAKSSTVANFSDQIFAAVGMPVLYPSNTQELLDFGLHGIAMSRHSGCWVGMKVVTDVVEGGGSVQVGPDIPSIRLPETPPLPPGGLNIRRHDGALPQEDRLYNHKLRAAMDYARANGLNQLMQDSPDARVGIVSAGKAWQDVLQALSAPEFSTPGSPAEKLRLLKIGMTWPLDPVIVREFARGLDIILIVEEKRPVLEDQVRALLYGGTDAPRIIGKRLAGGVFEPDIGDVAFPNSGELTPTLIAGVVSRALGTEPSSCSLGIQAPAATGAPPRMPGFCSGCPHNRSTRVVEGSRALAGIGCHTMAMLIDPLRTTTVSHMGAEGVMWLGQQAFTTEQHVFANIGDGTFAHSGFLAVRQAVAARVPITYKLLYNGFVAMTGGQAVETGLSPAQILHGLAAEGVKKMAVVTDDVTRYDGVVLPPGVDVHDRAGMEAVQLDFRTYPDVSVILYDQPCATERRRLRKRGKMADVAKRTFINAQVCEGCGDCGKASNCMSIEPLDTELGRKRRINQDSCNKDFTCVEGFCPSFVTVHGGSPRKKAAPAAALKPPTWSQLLPEPEIPGLTAPFNVLVGGVGGTGVVTVGQTLAVAAHLNGYYCSNLDVTGLSQKYGAVHSHVRLAPSPAMLHATRIGAGEAHTLVGCDLIVAAGGETLSRLDAGRSGAVISTDLIPTSEFARNADWSLDAQQVVSRLRETLGDRALFLDAQRLARSLLGETVASNMLVLGAAWQLGQIPLPLACIEKAIELNGVAVRMNLEAFTWGRRAANDLAAVELYIAQTSASSLKPVHIVRTPKLSLDELIARRSSHLIAHTGPGLAERYQALVRRTREAERRFGVGEKLSLAVAENYHKLLAVKDEWEVARLYDHPDFRAALANEFEGEFTLRFHLGTGPFARRNARTGAQSKTEVGPWMMLVFHMLARLRRLRGSLLDPFRHSAERALDRDLLDEYEADLGEILKTLRSESISTAVAIASLPGKIRGYGHVREAQATSARKEREKLWSEWRTARLAL